MSILCTSFKWSVSSLNHVFSNQFGDFGSHTRNCNSIYYVCLGECCIAVLLWNVLWTTNIHQTLHLFEDEYIMTVFSYLGELDEWISQPVYVYIGRKRRKKATFCTFRWLRRRSIFVNLLIFLVSPLSSCHVSFEFLVFVNVFSVYKCRLMMLRSFYFWQIWLWTNKNV